MEKDNSKAEEGSEELGLQCAEVGKYKQNGNCFGEDEWRVETKSCHREQCTVRATD